MTSAANRIVYKLIEGEDDDYLPEPNELLPDQPARARRAKYLPVGSISHGTMHPEHLAPKFIRAVRSIDPVNGENLMGRYESILAAEEPEAGDESLDYFVFEQLFDTLNDYAPPYTHFGSHEGDGSDYGVWIDHDSLVEDYENETEEDGLIALKVVPHRALASIHFPQPGYRYIVTRDDNGAFLGLYDAEDRFQYWHD